MEAVFGRKPEDLEDYYGLLGCDELSSTEQILNEYRIRALACHPDKHPDNPAAGKSQGKMCSTSLVGRQFVSKQVKISIDIMCFIICLFYFKSMHFLGGFMR
uniref:J domain-containing protein n=1 Tax=Fundulus heteroclitus TaxID=8078 RepID=A0A3Q2P359_FUNHE